MVSGVYYLWRYVSWYVDRGIEAWSILMIYVLRCSMRYWVLSTGGGSGKRLHDHSCWFLTILRGVSHVVRTLSRAKRSQGSLIYVDRGLSLQLEENTQIRGYKNSC